MLRPTEKSRVPRREVGTQGGGGGVSCSRISELLQPTGYTTPSLSLGFLICETGFEAWVW